MFNERFKCYSSMEKVMIDKMPQVEELYTASVLKNERFSFQIAYEFEPGIAERVYPVSFEVKSPLKKYITARKVGYIPSEMPLYPGKKDDCVISDKPGLYPDVLKPLLENVIYPHKSMCDSLWFTVDLDGTEDAGTYDISVEFKYEEKAAKEGEDPVIHTCTKTINLEIIDATLPQQKFLHFQWFHADCIATYYNIEIFSERHWEIIENFMKVAVRNGHNIIFTPLFTPPLDTKIGGERPTTQLVDISLTGDTYSFNFEKLDRWIALAQKIGYKYFDFPHLFTQWGAKFCPKIMATVDGEYKRIFGWDCESTSARYRNFLSQFLPAVTSYMENKGLKEYTFFHYSDEPRAYSIEDYKAAVAGAEKYLEGWTVMDALSDVQYRKDGILKTVITPTYHAEEFFEEGFRDIWIYYCSGHLDYYSNRFFAYPLWRTRILGLQLYREGINAFGTWGYNFYYSEESVEVLNPYITSDGGRAFPSGDAYSVYPGDDGSCLESIRLVSFHEAIQDIRALDLLSSYIGEDKVNELIDDVAGMRIKFNKYPTGAFFIQSLRRKVNQLIKQAAQEGKIK